MPSAEERNELIAAVAKGDQAFEVLFNDFAPRVAAFLMRGGTSATTAEELAQEVMVTLWRKAATFDPKRAVLSTWVFTIARNLRIDRHRHHGNEHIPLDPVHDDVVDPAPAAADRLYCSQRESRLREALRRLAPHQKGLIQLSYFAQMPHSEIARDLCLPLSTVKSRIRQALNDLRRELDI